MVSVDSRSDTLPTLNAPLYEFLAWVARSPRTYAETMEAWRSSCPRFTVWEDALEAGFIHVDGSGARQTAQGAVRLTPSGEAAFQTRHSGRLTPTRVTCSG